MKNWIFPLAMAVTLFCCFLVVKKNHEMAGLRADLAAANMARDENAANAADQERLNRQLQQQLRERSLDAPVARDSVPSVREPRPTAPANNPPTNVSRIFRDQLMKEALVAEARVGAVKSIQKLFDGGLAARLQLNDEQGAALRRLLEQRTSIFWDQMLVPMATGELNASDTGSTGQAIKQALDDNASQIRGLLGEDGYNTWKWFDKTQGERDEANQFMAAAANAGQGLTADQQSRLVDLMTSARANFNFQYDLGDPAQLDFQHWLDNFSENRLSAYQQDMEQLNSRIVEGAQNFLTADQTAQLKIALSGRLLQSLVTIRGTLATMKGDNP